MRKPSTKYKITREMKEYLKSGGILADHEWEDNFFSDLNCIQIDQVQWSLDKHPKIFFYENWQTISNILSHKKAQE